MTFVIARIASLSPVFLLCFIYYFSLFYYILDDDDDVPFRTDHIKEYFLSFLLFLWKSTFGRSIGLGVMLAAASYSERTDPSRAWIVCRNDGIPAVSSITDRR